MLHHVASPALDSSRQSSSGRKGKTTSLPMNIAPYIVPLTMLAIAFTLIAATFWL
jgi:hypothetical protein